MRESARTGLPVKDMRVRPFLFHETANLSITADFQASFVENIPYNKWGSIEIFHVENRACHKIVTYVVRKRKG